jgi:uncharacterized spore protein YtfJ
MVENLIDTLLGKLKSLVDSETVVGKAIEVGETTIIPITKISFGFAVGGNLGKDEKDKSSGSGGGAFIEPIAVITVEKGEVKVHSLKDGSLAKVFEMVPGILKKLTQTKGKKKGKSE